MRSRTKRHLTPLDRLSRAPSDPDAMDVSRISRCKKSTIAEAWAVVSGFPAAVVEAEATLIAHFARKTFPGLVTDPIIVVQAEAQEPTPPFWNQQLRSTDRMRIARFGHRFLAVHFVRAAQQRYETFETSLLPWLSGWLSSLAAAYDDPGAGYPIAKVGFGYINEFDFVAADFDLAKHFRVNVGIDSTTSIEGVEQLGLEFAWSHRDPEARVQVKLKAASLAEDDLRLQVRTQVFVDSPALPGASFTRHEPLIAQVMRTKELAKTTFFALATDSLRASMEPVDADQDDR
ncbi:MAG: hypothetical protein JNL90_12155 [Planctomycetes bacterium]|nr:hypothetical protein [Planctomycetota bacterium]